MPAPVIEREFAKSQDSIAVHLRLKDTVIDQLIVASCDILMERNAWGNHTLVETIELLRLAGSRRDWSVLSDCQHCNVRTPTYFLCFHLYLIMYHAVCGAFFAFFTSLVFGTFLYHDNSFGWVRTLSLYPCSI